MFNRMKLNLFLINLFFFCSSIYAFVEIYSLREIVSLIRDNDLIEKEVLIVFDIDNTLLEPSHIHGLGSDQWFSGLIEKYLSEGLTIQNAIAKAVAYYEHVQMHIEMQLIEDDIKEVIDFLKKNVNYHLICLTARSACLADKTIEQMHANGLDFHKESISEHHFDTQEKSVYKNGILFCGSNSKAVVLAKFLQKIDRLPDVIIFADDKGKNVKIIEQFADENGIQCFGLRYALCDEKVKNFDHQRAHEALEMFLMERPL